MSETGSTGKVVPIVKGHRTPDLVRDDAYRRWVAYGRSWVAVARELGCDEKTLRRWGKEDDWEARRQADLGKALPGIRAESAVSATIMGLDALVRLQQIAHAAAHDGIKPDYREVDALVKIAAVAGFSPSRPNLPDTHAIAPTTDQPTEDDATLTPEERLERARQRMAARYQDHWQ